MKRMKEFKNNQDIIDASVCETTYVNGVKTWICKIYEDGKLQLVGISNKSKDAAMKKLFDGYFKLRVINRGL